jgi:putative pyruvate formate lyase activating enzyme
MIPGQKIRILMDKVREIMRSCSLCPHKCGVNRLEGETGFCGLGADAYLFKHFIHYGEEGGLSPSYTVYLSGCSFRCRYCNNRDCVIKPNSYDTLDSREIARRINAAAGKIKNVNFLGGEPIVNLLHCLEILSFMNTDIPVVWNSNMYATKQVMSIINEIADIYLADFKFGCDTCAENIAECGKYIETIIRNLRMITPDKRIIIRHLPLPGHTECCSFPVIKMLAEYLPGVEISIISTLVPNSEFTSGCDDETLEKIANFAEKSGLKLLEQPSPDSISVEKHTGDELLETSIVLKPDGSVVFQDYNAEIAGLAEKLFMQ